MLRRFVSGARRHWLLDTYSDSAGVVPSRPATGKFCRAIKLFCHRERAPDLTASRV
jgi:hypothetical protein